MGAKCREKRFPRPKGLRVQRLCGVFNYMQGVWWDWSTVSEVAGMRGKERGARSYRALRLGDRPLYFQFNAMGRHWRTLRGQ